MKILEIEPVNNCNLRCIMCHMSFNEFNNKVFDINWLEKLNIKNGIVKVASIFEPLIHPKIDEIIEHFAKNNNKILITTNLTNLPDKLLRVLEKYEKNIYSITVSMDSTDKEIYESIRRNARYETVIQNIKKIRKIKSLYIRINSVLMKRNYKNILSDLIFWENLGIDELGFIFVTIRDMKTYNENLFDIKEDIFKKLNEVAEYVIRNNLNIIITSPYYKETKLREKYKDYFINNMVVVDKSKVKPNIYTREMNIDIPDYMKYECSALEKLVKIFADGEVQLCYQFNIGNMRDVVDFELFLKEKKEKIKEKILKDNICEKCDFYRFCIKGSSLNINKKENHFSNRFLSADKYIFLSKDTDIKEYEYLKDFKFVFNDINSLQIFKNLNNIDNVYLLDDIKDIKNKVFLVSDKFHFQVFITLKLLKKGAENIYIYSSEKFPKEIDIIFSLKESLILKKDKKLKIINEKHDGKLIILNNFEPTNENNFLAMFKVLKDIINYKPKLIAIAYWQENKEFVSLIVRLIKELNKNLKIALFNVKEKPIATLMSNAVDFVLEKDNIEELFLNLNSPDKVKNLYYYDKYLDVVHT